jgi:hypothetical protein
MPGGGAEIQYMPKKTRKKMVKRKGVISSKTYALLKQYNAEKD